MRFPVLRRFSSLLGAHIWREVLQGLFLLALARRDPVVYGEMMLGMQVGAILLFMSEAGLNPYLVEHLTHDEGRQQFWMRRFAGIRLLLLGVGLAGAVFFTFQQGYAPRLRLVVWVLGVAIGLDALVNTFCTGLQVGGHQGQEGRIRIGGATLGWGYSIAALAAGWGVLRMVAGKCIETAVNLIGAFRASTEKAALTQGGHSGPVVLPRWRRGIPYAALAAAALLYNKANVFFLQQWGGSAAVAQYSATWQLVDAVPVLISSLLLGRVLYPLLVHAWHRDTDRLRMLVLQTAQWLSLIGVSAVLFLGLGSPLVIRLLYGPAFGEAALLQPILVWCVPFALLHNLAAYLLLAAGHRRFLVVVYGAALVLNLALCRLLIPEAPLYGAAWAMVLTKGVLSLATVAAACRLSPFWRSRALLELGLTAGTAIGVYLMLFPWMGCYAVFPALLPPAGCAWLWWKAHIHLVPSGSSSVNGPGTERGEEQ